MGTSTIWPIAGLAYGTALGLATAFGGFGAFAAVLVFGVIGFLIGRVLAGDLDLGEVFGSARARGRGTPS